MRAESARQQRLLDLQAIDTRLDQIAHARSHLPQLAELADLEGKKRLLEDQLVRSRTELGALLQGIERAVDVTTLEAQLRQIGEQQRLPVRRLRELGPALE